MRLAKRQKDAPRKKARAFVVTTTGGILPLSVLEKAEIKKSDKQLNEETDWIGTDKLAKHPYPSESFYFMWESNVMLWRCTKQIATDVAGLGWTLKPREDMAENEAEYKKIMNFILKPNPDMSFRKLNEGFIIDFGVTGNSAFQVVRTRDTEVNEVWHMPTGSVWAHTEGKKFCQKKGTEKVWFAKFAAGENNASLILDPKNGEEKDLNIKERANELIFYHSYYPKSRWYGVPNMLPATGDILTGLGIRDFNLSFFTNHGVPDHLVSLTGDWESGDTEDDIDAIQVIRDYLANIKGADKAHNDLVVDIPDGCEIKIDPISVQVQEGSFKILKTMVDEDVRVAYSMPPYRIGIPTRAGSLAGDIASEMTTNYINGVVEPLQTDLEEIWSDKIFKIGLNCPSYQIAFKNLDIRNEAIEHEEDMGKIRTATMTPNQYREKRGLKPYPGGYTYYMDATLVPVGEDDVEED